MQLESRRGEVRLSCCLPRDHNYSRTSAQQENQSTARVSGTSELGSCAIFTKKHREAHNLLALEEPVDLGVKCGGNCLPQRISGFPASVNDPAEVSLVNANHLGKAVLADPCFVDRQLQVWVNRSLVEFHFLLASLDFVVKNNLLRAPKSTTSFKNLPRCNGTHVVTYPSQR
jgi:hypothetical protein